MALDFAAGCLGGCAGVIVGHPLDTVKVHLQTQDAKRPQFRGTWHCLQSIAAQEGMRGLYRGMSSPLAGVAGINAIIFGVYGNTQRRLRDPDSLKSHLLAGSLAGLVQSGLCSPMELAKSRAQVAGNGISPLQCLKNIYKQNGIRGVFRGLGITMTREVPAFGSYFVTYEVLTRSENGKPVSTASMLLAGGLAGSVSWLIVYPVDVLKTRLQIDGMNGPPKYSSAYDCLRKSLAAEGHGFLMRGVVPTVVRAFPTNAACFTVVTWTMRLCAEDINVDVVTPVHENSLWLRYGDAVTAFTPMEILPA